MEQTLVIIKPEAVIKKHIGDIISIYEENQLEMIHAHRFIATKDILEQHYEALKGKDFFEGLLSTMSASDIVVIILRGEDAVRIVREINGATDPSKAKPGTIRQLYGTSIRNNAVHGSESLEASEREISIWAPYIGYTKEA